MGEIICPDCGKDESKCRCDELEFSDDNSDRLLINAPVEPKIKVTGIDGLRQLLNVVAESWRHGSNVVLDGIVTFIPQDSKPQPFTFEVSPVIYPKQQGATKIYGKRK